MTMQFKARSARQQRRLRKQIQKVAKKVDSMVFFNLLTSPQLLEPLERLLPEFRERLYPPTETLSMFLGQVLSADGSCQNAVNEAIVHRVVSGLSIGSANTAAYCEARQRLPPRMARELARRTSTLLDAHTPPRWLWRGRHVKLVDGTTIQMPDTAANQEQFPQHGGQKSGAGFPIARLVGVISLAHGAVLDVAMGPYQGKGTGEHGLFRELLGCFSAGDVMVADSYYPSYFLIAELRKRGVDFLFEQHGARNTDFRSGEKLGSCDHVVSWSKPRARPKWMTEQEYDSYPDELTVRETKVRDKVLVGSFLKPREMSRLALGKLFLQRWHVELDLRNIKATLGMGQLSCKTPSMCAKELGVYLLAYNLIRLLMAQAALNADVLPRQLSFKHTVQVWVAWNQRQFLSNTPEDLAALFALIAHKRVGNRPGRIEPRAVKQRPKPFPRLQTTRRRARRDIKLRGRPKKLQA
jgi:hypothetical protein